MHCRLSSGTVSSVASLAVAESFGSAPSKYIRNNTSLRFLSTACSTFSTSTPSYPKPEADPHASGTGGSGHEGAKAPNNKYWKYDPKSDRHQRPIFVAATKQHVGKTSTSLAIVSGLQKRFDKVGFIKPVGQQHVDVRSETLDATIKVDKDVCLVRERFNLHHLDYEYMSPVIIPRGYTKKFIDGEITYEKQIADIEESFKHVSECSDVVLAEGTGHCAVGSIVNVNNAKVASILGADMVLIANGGLGSAFDELELNRILCQHYNVRIAGVVINKVRKDKYEQTKHYMAKALKQAWGVPLLGCVPDRPYLGCPALFDLERLFHTKLVCGHMHRFRHYNVNDINLVTTSLTRFLENLREKASRTLYVCHVTRDDLILGFMAEYQRTRRDDEKPFEAALVVCGRKGKYQLSNEVKDMVYGLEGAPVMIVDLSTHQAMQKIHAYTPKLNIDDKNRVTKAVEHYEPYIDFDELLRRTRSDNSSFNVPGDINFDDLRTR
mmetsp:Transcript_19396/g.41855  ORF Transcript_19396/g.41855 Transcript_19396/m.41855 type:complete len:494 (+) Transcript_19396:139-1620(+)